MKKYIVGKTTDIPPGGKIIVDIAKFSVGVYNIDGTFYAVRNRCPHAGGPVCEGVTSGLLRAETPDNYEYIRRGEILRCPWHGWEFDVKTGQSWFDPAKTKTKSYVTTVESGRELAESDAELASAGFEPGPYKTEMFEVEVEDDFVVVHI